MHDPSRVRFTGPLEPYAEGFRAELARQGYTAISATGQLRLAAHASRWMATRGRGVSALTPEVVDDFLRERRRAGYWQLRSAKAMAPLLGYLRGLGVVSAAERAPTPVEALLERYRAYLITERGLAASSAAGYLDAVRPFLAGHARPGGMLDLIELTPGEITAFVLAECARRRRGSAKLMATALRSLLGFLHVAGLVARPLASAVPSVASWRLSGLPRALGPGEVRRLLASCDRTRPAGLRDLAILTMLVRLGLRAGELAALDLDDIDWRAGEIVIRGKGDRHERLPLPADVGAAHASYLRRGRPAAPECRRLFLRARAPRHGLTSAGVSQVVVGASRRAGLSPIAAHRLRHTAACQMLRAGASLSEIGQLLRHRSALTTAIYAKVDRDALRACARPWPGSAP